MRTERLLALAALIGCALAAPARAQDPAIPAPEVRRVTVDTGASQTLRVGDRIANVAIAASDIADVAAFEPDHLLITGKQPGTTTATVWTRTGAIVSVLVEVTHPVATMRAALRAALPDAERLEVTSAGKAIILSGRVASAADVERAEAIVRGLARGSADAVGLVNALTVAGSQQVQLEVAFAEVSRSSLREIGFNFWSRHQGSNGRGYAGGILAPTTDLRGASPELDNAADLGDLNHGDSGLGADGAPVSEAVPLLRSPLTGTFGFIFSSTLGGFPFSAALSLLANKGYARTLAEPTLVAMSGKSASFLAGGEFPIPLPQSLGQIGVEYRKFGIQLQFTPTVVGDDIQLDLGVTVSDIDFSLGVRLASTTVPGLTERHSQTSVRLRDGQSFVVAGLLSDNVRSSSSKVPWLGDVPVLGALFRSSSFRREETELLVVVTAHLVHPTGERPKLPGEDTTTDPGDLELFLLGRTESKPTRGAGASAGNASAAPAGAVGFAR